ncbi:MAG: tetratricopeptide repeat protein [Aliidongia sp.]
MPQSFVPGRPAYSKAELLQQGTACHRAGQFEQAETAYRQILALDPREPEALHLLGLVADQTQRHEEAIDYIAKAIRLKRDRPHYHNNLALALRALGRYREAEQACRTALRLKPDYPLARNNLGMILRSTGKLAEAELCYRDVLRQNPDFPEVYNNLGNLLCQRGQVVEGEHCFRAALHLPANPALHREVRYNLAQALLLTGRLEEGWQYYEVRAEVSGAVRRDLSAPLWNGQPTGERVLLLHAEQGLGDTLQFCRYAPIVARGSTLVLEVQQPLVRLLSNLPGIAAIIPRGEKLPRHDAQCSLLSVPRVLGTRLETIPGETPYLAADPVASAAWRARLAGLGGLKIGLVWAGGSRPELPWAVAVDGRRSITLKQMSPLAGVAGVSFVSLQKDRPSAQAADPPAGLVLHDFTAELDDFTDTAALIVALDLVISVDTAVAHLAGALGKPVWLLNRFDSCWRWLLDRDDSPWYPTLRQFRQKSAGDWAGVMAEVRTALSQLTGTDNGDI